MTDPQQPTKDKPCAALEVLQHEFPYQPEGTELDPGGHVAWQALKDAGPFDRRADVVPREVYEALRERAEFLEQAAYIAGFNDASIACERILSISRREKYWAEYLVFKSEVDKEAGCT